MREKEASGTRSPRSATRTFTASADPTRRVDENGVVIGPWSDSVKRMHALQRKVRRHSSGHPIIRSVP
jgi:hypothetical protein